MPKRDGSLDGVGELLSRLKGAEGLPPIHVAVIAIKLHVIDRVANLYRRLKISWKGISCPLGKIALTSMVMVFPSADIERVPVLFTWPLNLATMFTE